MKKIILSVCTFVAFSLTTQAQFKVGILAGGNQSELRVNGNANLFSSDHFRSYHAGLVGDWQIGNKLFLQPQLLYVRKGGTLSGSTEATSSQLRMNHINLAMNIVHKFPLSFGKVFIGAGPSITYAISGTQEMNGQKKKLYKEVKDWKREDVGVNVMAGLELKNGLFANFSAQRGLMDVYKLNGASVKNRSYSVSVGYLINWKKGKDKRS